MKAWNLKYKADYLKVSRKVSKRGARTRADSNRDKDGFSRLKSFSLLKLWPIAASKLVNFGFLNS